jgi:hypothetical protein
MEDESEMNDEVPGPSSLQIAYEAVPELVDPGITRTQFTESDIDDSDTIDINADTDLSLECDAIDSNEFIALYSD